MVPEDRIVDSDNLDQPPQSTASLEPEDIASVIHLRRSYKPYLDETLIRSADHLREMDNRLFEKVTRRYERKEISQVQYANAKATLEFQLDAIKYLLHQDGSRDYKWGTEMTGKSEPELVALLETLNAAKQTMVELYHEKFGEMDDADWHRYDSKIVLLTSLTFHALTKVPFDQLNRQLKSRYPADILKRSDIHLQEVHRETISKALGERAHRKHSDPEVEQVMPVIKFQHEALSYLLNQDDSRNLKNELVQKDDEELILLHRTLALAQLSINEFYQYRHKGIDHKDWYRYRHVIDLMISLTANAIATHRNEHYFA